MDGAGQCSATVPMPASTSIRNLHSILSKSRWIRRTKVQVRTLARRKLFPQSMDSLQRFSLQIIGVPNTAEHRNLASHRTFVHRQSASTLPCLLRVAACDGDPRIQRKSRFAQHGGDARAGTSEGFPWHCERNQEFARPAARCCTTPVAQRCSCPALRPTRLRRKRPPVMFVLPPRSAAMRQLR